MTMTVVYQGVTITIHERRDWEPDGYPVQAQYRFRLDPTTGRPIPGSGYLNSTAIWPRRIPSNITHQAVHYTADETVPDGDDGETVQNVKTYLQAMQISYARHRAYSLGYSWMVDWLGGIWVIRGTDVKCAAHAPANDYADAILVLVDGSGKASDLAAHSIRYLVHRAEQETRRMQFVVGHKELNGAATACPGAGLMDQIKAGVFYPRPDKPVEPTNPIDILGGNDMAQIISITDNGQAMDLAVFAVTGTFVEWIGTENRLNALVLIKAVEHDGVEGAPPAKPFPIDRGFLQYFTLVGQPPVYPSNYVGPKTSPADFAKWVS